MPCPDCAEEQATGAEFCGKCFALFRRPEAPGLLERLTRWLPRRHRRGDRPVSPPIAVEARVEEVFEVADVNTGETRRYGSLDELPPELREAVESARRGMRSRR